MTLTLSPSERRPLCRDRRGRPDLILKPVADHEVVLINAEIPLMKEDISPATLANESEVGDPASRAQRGSLVSDDAVPFDLTGRLSHVLVTMQDEQTLDGDGVGRAEMARQ